MSQPKAVIFDVDGVLVDSYQAHWHSWHDTVQELGLDMTEEQFASTFGRTSREILAQLYPDHSYSDEKIREIDDRKEELYRQIVADDFPEMAGANELIDALIADGFKVGVGSSGPPENVELALSKLGRTERFEAAVTGRDVTKGKPDPEVFLTAASRLEIEPRWCAVIEDAKPGIAAARAAKMLAIGFLSTGHTPADFENAHWMVKSLGELSPTTIFERIQQLET